MICVQFMCIFIKYLTTSNTPASFNAVALHTDEAMKCIRINMSVNVQT